MKKNISSFLNLEMTTIVKELILFKKLMDEYKINFFLISGTLLGLYRDGKLIEHDKDIDIGVMEEVNLYPLLEKFKTLNYESNLMPVSKGNILWVKKKFEHTVLVFEIQQYYRKNEFIYYNRPLNTTFKFPEGRCVWDKKIFDTFATLEFENIKFNIPALTEEYLDTYYMNWKKPEQYIDWRYHCKNLKEGYWL